MSSTSRVAPFGNLRINSYVPIPAAYRSLSRPSSPSESLGIPHTPFVTFLNIILKFTFSFVITYHCACNSVTIKLMFNTLVLFSLAKMSKNFILITLIYDCTAFPM